MTDNELIQICLKGNDSVFKEIIHRYESKIASTVIGMLGDCPEAQDVGQETFIRFYKNLSSFRGDSSVGTYLTRIAMNLSLNELKRRKRGNRNVSIDEPEIMNQAVEYSNSSNQSEHQEIVWQAIQQLPLKYRSPLVLRMIDGYSTQETAQILNLAQGTVLSRLSRAKSKLFEILEPYKELL